LLNPDAAAEVGAEFTSESGLGYSILIARRGPRRREFSSITIDDQATVPLVKT
jgi:hypothetical protein